MNYTTLETNPSVSLIAYLNLILIINNHIYMTTNNIDLDNQNRYMMRNYYMLS